MTLQERRTKKEGFGRLYMDKQLREKTPMAFVTYDAAVEGVLYKRLVYDLDIMVGEEKVRINKLFIKYCYKQEHADIVSQFLQWDAAVRAQSLPALKPRKERFQIDSRHLALARKNKWPIRLTLRGGEVFQGPIDWYSAFEIKMNLGERGSVVLFRHAAYDFQLVREPVHVARRPVVEARR